MRVAFSLAPLLVLASPAAAQGMPVQLPRELTDPAAAQRLSYEIQALSHALLNVRIGEVRAAAEGREATRQERNMTVGDLARSRDPDFDRHLNQQVASIGPAVQHGMKALNRALPEVMRDVRDAQKSLERAVSNLPDPTYPQR